MRAGGAQASGPFNCQTNVKTPSCFLTGAVLTAAFLTATARAGEPPPRPHRLTFAARAAFQVRASFTSSLPPATTRPGPATGGGLLRTYDDGFVGVDSRNNPDGQTWFWGYLDPAQYQAGAATLGYTARTSTARSTSPERDDDPQFGGELSYARSLFEWGRAFWGVELGAAFTPLKIEDAATLTGTAQYLRDTYTLVAPPPPAAPYIGTHHGPGPLLNDAPTRTQVTREVVYTGRREIEASLFGFRLGPVLDIPMGEPLSLQLSGGAYVVYADAEFMYAETATIGGGNVGAPRGRVEKQDWTLGAYVRGQVLLSLSPALGVFAGGEYLMLDALKLANGSPAARLDFDESFAVLLGVAVNF